MNRLGEKSEIHSKWFVVTEVISIGNTSVSDWFYILFSAKRRVDASGE